MVPPPRAAVLNPCKGKIALPLCPHSSHRGLFLNFRGAHTEQVDWERSLVVTHP